ncbi:MAG: DUF4835 family protein [Bacteroidota bacterium]|nr:DUF4835 family protein [Bacteroidota bacterium]
MKRTLVVLLLLVAGSPLQGQEIQLYVESSAERLTPSQREYIAELPQKIMTYVNERRWTDIDFRGDKIPVTMQIDFLTGSDGGEFSAQVVIASQRRTWENGRPTPNTTILLRILDPKWSFTYFKGQPLFYDEFQFDDLRSFIDFYMYIILGLDFDSYELMQGTPYYQRAIQIGQRSQSSTRASEWQGSQNQYSRMNFLSELQNAQYEGFRRALYWYYYEGLDFMTTEKPEAQKAIATALEEIADALSRSSGRSLVLTMFLESKSPEFCALLEGFPERKRIMNVMIQADPPRGEMYRRCAF